MKAAITPRIKICGLKDKETIEAMNGLPVNEIGFIFAPSRRRIDIAQAPELIRAVHSLAAHDGQKPRAVGVFVNAAMEELDQLLASARLDVVQLHGDETPEYCAELRRRHPGVHIWKVFSIANKNIDDPLTNDELKESVRRRMMSYQSCVDAVLIDAPGGGTGQAFNWEVIEQYQSAANAAGLPLYVAGGLHADNVQILDRKSVV